MAVSEVPIVAKKTSKPAEESKRNGTLIRVSDEFASLMKKASSLRDESIGDFADKELLDRVREIYAEALSAETKELQGKTK